MTTIFTRNFVIFILTALSIKCAINVDIAPQYYIKNKMEKKISLSNKEKLTPLVENSCLSTETSFHGINIGSNSSSIGTVNIARQERYIYDIYNKKQEPWYITETIPLSDIVLENKMIVNVSQSESEIIARRMLDSVDIGYIVSGTAIEEIYNNPGINKIEKIKPKSRSGIYYLVELASVKESGKYGEEFLSHIDKIRRFTIR